MDFGVSNRPVCQANLGVALPFPPTAFPVPLLEAAALSNASTGRKGLDVGDVADDREIHRPSSPRTVGTSIRGLTSGFSRGG